MKKNIYAGRQKKKTWAKSQNAGKFPKSRKKYKLTTWQRSDGLQQYQRRACIVLDGMKPVDGVTEDKIKENVQNVLINNLGLDEEKVDNETDKCNRLWRIKGQYMKRKKIMKNKKLQVNISLTY